MQARILVVDDDARSRKLMQAILSPLGCSVSEAANGQEALQEVEFGRWDVVLLDVNMPGMDGFEVLRRIREKHSMEKIPVIMVTGHDDSESRSRALELRANEFLSKPVDHPELMARVGSMLAMRKAQLELEERCGALTELQEWKEGVLDALAHDMRSLLDALAREMPVLGKSGGDAGAAEAARQATENIKRAIALTENMLEVSGTQSRLVRPPHKDAPASSSPLG